MKRLFTFAIAAVLSLGTAGLFVHAQNVAQGNTTVVQEGLPLYYTTAISSTGAVNNQVTLTIPAPAAGLYNYVCQLTFTASQDGTSSANTNQVTTATNFNSFALKYSLEATANKSLVIQALAPSSPAAGCTKSAASATATTFVSPAAIANTAFTWYATYFQAP